MNSLFHFSGTLTPASLHRKRERNARVGDRVKVKMASVHKIRRKLRDDVCFD